MQKKIHFQIYFLSKESICTWIKSAFRVGYIVTTLEKKKQLMLLGYQSIHPSLRERLFGTRAPWSPVFEFNEIRHVKVSKKF
jgi:hypothetical protein